MSDMKKYELRKRFLQLSKDAEKYFIESYKALFEQEPPLPFSGYEQANYFWDKLPEELHVTANSLVDQVLAACAELVEMTRSSALAGSEDLLDAKLSTKGMRAALRLRRYRYHRADVIHDEGTVLGFSPAEQSENQGLDPASAQKEFENHLSTIGAVLKLVEAVAAKVTDDTPLNVRVGPNKYQSGTAFIMMWMDPHQPDLSDVADTVRSVFRSFGVKAIRADDIEHEGKITDRIISEIQTSEFLFADLTGARPNVYYEVGFAHALGKRVILFRKSGTNLHFDLSGYNCPEYANLQDLRNKLKNRLVSLTNRNPTESVDF